MTLNKQNGKKRIHVANHKILDVLVVNIYKFNLMLNMKVTD